MDEHACDSREFCENTVGSFRCYECDPACKTSCSGRGADKCIGECSSGYRTFTSQLSPDTVNCMDVNECEEAAADKPACGEKLKCVNKVGGYECVGM